jgi:hypothetical protein
MNWAHVHLIINHFPVIGILGAILLLVYSLVRKSEEVKMVSLSVFAIIALITLAVYFTGGAAEEVVKNLPGVTETYMQVGMKGASLTLQSDGDTEDNFLGGARTSPTFRRHPEVGAVMILVLS